MSEAEPRNLNISPLPNNFYLLQTTSIYRPLFRSNVSGPFLLTPIILVPFLAVYGMEAFDLEGVIPVRDDPRYIKLITDLNFPRSDWSVTAK